jgi:uncharacterized protein
VPAMEVAGLTVFILLLFGGVYLTIFGLPGTVVILVDVLCYSLFTGFDKIGFKIIAVLILTTFVAESIGFVLEIKDTVRFGPSVKGIAASLAGAFLGALLLTPVLMGLGALIGIFFGGFMGFLTLELARQSSLKPAFRASPWAILSSAAGIITKGCFAVVMTLITLTSIYS